tara:strand:+ start:1486 stop:1830 length:345 start_codon:yes stop_codon:yes gene_type:complete
MDDDTFFLAWLARECRFQASVHYAPRTRIGYRIARRVIVSPKDEPKLNMWLASKGINTRIIKNQEQIQHIIRLLATVKQYVKDIEGMSRMLKIIELNKRRLTHQDILDAIILLE